jgi:ribonuclease BN (tRNA processing enzyme)
MQARLLFLGTGGDALVIGKQMRGSAGVILNIDTDQFHLDPGPGSLLVAKMFGVNLRETSAIFVTGNELFKANDVNAVISAMTHDGMDRRGVLVCPSNLISGELPKKGPFLNSFYKECLEKTIAVDNTRKIGVNNIDIEIVELEEPITTNIGLRFITQKFTLSYIPDTMYNNSLGEKFKDTDILILNVQDPRNFKRKEHLNSEDAEKIIAKVNPQIAIITGFGVKMLQADALYEAREIQKNTGINVISAKDGMTINPMSFTTTVRQKNLTSY